MSDENETDALDLVAHELPHFEGCFMEVECRYVCPDLEHFRALAASLAIAGFTPDIWRSSDRIYLRATSPAYNVVALVIVGEDEIVDVPEEGGAP